MEEKIKNNSFLKSSLIFFVIAFLFSCCFFIFFNFWQSFFEDSLYYYFSEQNFKNFGLAQVKFYEDLKNKQLEAEKEMENLLAEKGVVGDSILVLEIKPDGSGRTIIKKNDQKKQSIASLTKLFTSLTVLNNFDLEKNIVISKEAVNQEGAAGGLKIGETIKAKELLYPLLIESSNDAAYALSESIGLFQFVELMNSEVKKIGLSNSSFSNPIGEDEDGNFSNTRDLSVLTAVIMNDYPEIFEISKIKEKKLYVSCDKNQDGLCFHHNMKNTNILLSKIEGVIGSKTGFSPAANGCLLMIVQRGESKFIDIVLNSSDRFGDMEKLIYYFNK
ncbi:MAG: serine hydrolase [bacterium]|nr:serine hydrolase [bacterium]